MKKKKIKIQIAEPCHVNAERFSKVTGGYYCDLCTKCVVDYTSWSDKQIYDTLSENKRKDLCGIFRPEQLSKVYQNKTNPAAGFFSSLVLSGLLLTARNGAAQSEIESDTTFETKILPGDSAAINTDTTKRVKQEGDSISIDISKIELIDEVEGLILTTTYIDSGGTYGFMQIEEAPLQLPFQDLIDSTKKFVSGMLIGLGGKNGKPGIPKKNPVNNNDRPVWIESLKNRFRRKRKK